MHGMTCRLENSLIAKNSLSDLDLIFEGQQFENVTIFISVNEWHQCCESCTHAMDLLSQGKQIETLTLWTLNANLLAQQPIP